MACYTQGMIDGYRKEGYYRHNPVLKIGSYDGKAIATFGFASSLRKAHGHLHNSSGTPVACNREIKGRILKVERLENSDRRSPVMLSINGRYFGMVAANQDKSEVWIPEEFSLKLLEIIQLNLDTDAPILEKFRITSQNGLTVWNPIPMGATRNVYLRQGDWDDNLVSNPCRI